LPLADRIETITYDNGKEFASHAEIVAALGAKSYFAKPYHSWERGLNEHTNGLVRQYFPKGTDFSTLSNADAKRIARPTVSETAGANEELGRLECQATGSESRSFISH
jgi:IS30 family transposase